jgi:hypothetical protein
MVSIISPHGLDSNLLLNLANIARLGDCEIRTYEGPDCSGRHLGIVHHV